MPQTPLSVAYLIRRAKNIILKNDLEMLYTGSSWDRMKIILFLIYYVGGGVSDLILKNYVITIRY